MSKPNLELEKVELHEDAWPRFERFIGRVTKAGPQHRQKPDGDAPAAAPKPRRKKAREA